MADLDPIIEEPLDWFSLILPLPYRLATVTVFGVWLWGLNLHGLSKTQIDTASLIRYHANYLSVYRFAAVLSIPLISSLLLYWTLTRGSHHPEWDFLPNATLLIVPLAFIIPSRYTWPKQLLPHMGRIRLLSSLRRCLVGGLAQTEDGKFGDILLADALTSYAKPISELYVALCMLVTRQSTTGAIDRACGATWIVPLLLSAPYAMRFRQCLLDSQRLNALKYATAFPAIALSVLMRVNQSPSIAKLWFVAAITNALYSFYWDVYWDWDLDLQRPELRGVRLFGDTGLYWAMIGVDLLLRLAWAMKLSPHLEHYYDIEGGIFLLEVLEVLRRWLWVYFRVEAESIKTQDSADVLLGDLGPKTEQD